MNATAKYLFDVDFGPGKKVSTTIPLTEHAALVAEAETRGYRNGFQAAEAEGKAETTRRLAIALEQAAEMLMLMGQGLKEIDARLEVEAIAVAYAVARKLAPELIAREPMAEIEALASGIFRQLLATPHVVVRVSERLYEPAREKLERISQESGFDGRLVLLAEPGMADGDCRIEWADGGLTRDSVAAEKLIAETVQRFVAARHDHAD